jgi:hypothetical protein
MRRWLFLQLTQVLLFLSDCFRRHLLGYIKSLDGRRVDVGLDPSPFPVRLGDGVYCTGERDTDPEAASFRFSYGHIPIQGWILHTLNLAACFGQLISTQSIFPSCRCQELREGRAMKVNCRRCSSIVIAQRHRRTSACERRSHPGCR